MCCPFGRKRAVVQVSACCVLWSTVVQLTTSLQANACSAGQPVAHKKGSPIDAIRQIVLPHGEARVK